MKKILFLAALIAALFTTACSNDYDDFASSNQVKTMSVRFAGDFSYKMSTRATSIEKPQDVWIFDYKDGILLQTIRKSEFDNDITNPKITMEYGKHTLYCILSYGQFPTIEEFHHQIWWGQVGDTFYKKEDITIDSKTNSTIDITLDRMVTLLKVESLDNVPEDVEYLTVIPSKWYSGIDYLSGKAASTLSYKNYMFNIKKSNTTVECYLYGFTDEHSTDVEFNVKKNGILFKKSIAHNIPFKPNRVTALKGNLFTDENTANEFNFNLQTNDEWDTQYNTTL
jgi:hypothetical protein